MTYQDEKITELITKAKAAVDILLGSLEEEFDFEDVADSSKLKSFIESKKIAFFSSKEMILEIDKLEKQVGEGNLSLEDKEYDNNFLENQADNVK